MEEEYVSVLQIPLKVACLGGVTPTSLIKNPLSKPKELVLIIPGNVGLTSFYESFAVGLYRRLELPVWIVSHGGHEPSLPAPPLSTNNKELYTVEGQIWQKQEFIETYLKGINLRVIGHSASTHMILKLLRTSCEKQIAGAYLLFPGMGDISSTLNGRIFAFVIKYLLWLLLAFAYILPRCVLKCFVYVYSVVTSCALDMVDPVVDHLQPGPLKNVFFLLEDALKVVKDRDDKIIKKNIHRIWFLYATGDNWAPQEFYEDLVKSIPGVRAEIDREQGFQHCFSFKSADEVADLTAAWIAADRNTRKYA